MIAKNLWLRLIALTTFGIGLIGNLAFQPQKVDQQPETISNNKTYQFVAARVAIPYPLASCCDCKNRKPFVPLENISSFLTLEDDKGLIMNDVLSIDVRADKNRVVSLYRDEVAQMSQLNFLQIKLERIFEERQKQGFYENFAIEKLGKTVFVRPSLELTFGEVMQLFDAVKETGASPVALQLDDSIKWQEIDGLPKCDYQSPECRNKVINHIRR